MGYYLILGRRERTADLTMDNLAIQTSISDRMPQIGLELLDIGCISPVAIQQEILLIDEATSNPTHNLLLNTQMFNPVGAQNNPQPSSNTNPNGQWNFYIPGNTSITQATYQSSSVLEMSTNNALLGSWIEQWSQPNAVADAMSYCFSIFLAAATAISNMEVILELDYYNSDAPTTQSPGGGGSGGHIGSTSVTIPSSSLTSSLTRYSLIGNAPSGTQFVAVSVTFLPTVASNNSGTLAVTEAQLEPLWFSSYGQSYPTPFCNGYQPNCYQLPDGTGIRQTRLFAGRVSLADPTYDGPDRIYSVTCQSLQYLLEIRQINKTYKATTDYAIIQDICTNWLDGMLSYNHAVQGATFDRTYDDYYLSEVLNDLCNTTNFYAYVDHYADLHYGPIGQEQASFRVSDNQSEVNGTTVLSYTQWKNPHDGTQIGNHVIVKGGNFLQTTVDPFTGDGTTTKFFLTQPQPQAVLSVQVGGVEQKKGINGNAGTTFAGGYQVLIDYSGSFLLFGTAPASNASITCQYSFNGQIRVDVYDMISYDKYKLWFDRVVNDTTIVTTAAAQARGQQELAKYALEMQTPRFQMEVTGPVAGQILEISNTLEGLSKAPYIVQQVTLKLFANSFNLYEVQCGADIPTFSRFIKHLHKSHTRSKKVALGNVALNTTLVIVDSVVTGVDSVAGALAASNPGSYGSGVYGTTQWD